MPSDHHERIIDDLNAEMDQLLYAISHDLCAPLRAIDGFSQAVLEDYESRLDDAGRDFLKRIRQGARTINDYVDGILMISRQSRGELVLEEVDMSALVHEVGASVARAYPDHAPELTVSENVSVVMDRRLARCFLEKLLDNAWKFTRGEKHARVEFGMEEQEGATVCFIRDNGAGFDVDFAGDRLFGPFQRFHEQEIPGLGIGLATAKRIINRHGGRLWAKAAPGDGATFYFSVDR